MSHIVGNSPATTSPSKRRQSGSTSAGETTQMEKTRPIMYASNTESKRRRLKGWLLLITAAMIVLFGAIAMIGIVPAVFPSVGAGLADLLRTALGPQPVADLESISFKIQDMLNQYRAAQDGGKPLISFSTQPAPQIANIAPTPLAITPRALTKSGTPLHALQVVPQISNTSNSDVLAANPQIGWQAYGPTVNGAPVMARALLLLDPQRSYAGIALVRIDLSKLQLHMMPGYEEPSHALQVVQGIPNLGMVPPADQTNLIAAFNGGFKAVNGHYGMMMDGVTLLPPLPDIATVAIYQDGHVQIGAWGQDIQPSSNIIAYRQNCPLLIQAGQINPGVYTDNRQVWGDTIGNKEVTWRTGLGITQDGRYLIYAVGNGTSVDTLAQAMQQAGAYNAMQLDINQHFAHFVTYQPTGNVNANGLPAFTMSQLLSQMENSQNIYVMPHMRDFFYLTTH